MEKVPGFTLSQLIKNTASELRKAKVDNPADGVIQLIGCEMELAVTMSAEAGGGFKIWLLDASGKAKGEHVSKVKLTWSPLHDGAIIASATDGDIVGPAAKPRKSGKK